MTAYKTLVQNCALSLVILLTCNLANADMFVDRSIVIFDAESKPREDVKVSNSGDENIYVQVEVLEVLNPGTKEEERIRVTDPSKLKLIATPNKLVIPPGGQKLIRIVNLAGQDSEEHVYRINVTPILAPLEDDTSQLRIVVAYQILTIVQAKKPSASLNVERKGKTITFHNQGNTNLLLADGRQCDQDNQCQDLTSKRLYAGNTWVLSLPLNAPVTYSIRSFDGIKKEVYQ